MNNIFVSFGALTPLSWAIIFEVCLFIMQLLFCLKVKNNAVKCIPLGVVGLGLLFGILTTIGAFGSYSAGAVSGNGIAGFFILCVVGIASIGIVLAWIVYGVTRWIRRKTTA